MAKQIKKVLFHQVSAFLGLTIIVAFSSIFGAILLHQALAAPDGTGSILTAVNAWGNSTQLQLNNAMSNGTPFDSNLHSLKQIRNKLDTMGGGVIWAGYTSNTLGNMGGIIGANQKCNTAYAGSHTCTYDEILKLGVNYPNSINAWIIDGGYTLARDFYYLQCTRDGFCNSQMSPDILCKRWTDDTGSAGGVYLNRNGGYLSLMGCNVATPLPCCK